MLGGAVAVSGLALLAACGGDDDDDTSDDAVATATETDTEAATESAAETEAATDAETAEETEAETAEATEEATTEEAAAGEAGEWTFTDDVGNVITLPKRPERIVAYISCAAALWDVGIRPVGVYGTLKNADGVPEVTVGEVDLDSVVSLGEVYGELDMEALIQLEPDLIIYDHYWPELDLWGVPPETIEQIRNIAPICGIKYVGQPITDTISKFEELAGLLGADLEAPELVEQRKQFDQASEKLKTAIEAKPGLKTIFVSGWTDAYYVANPDFWADINYFAQLGLDTVDPPDAAEDQLWETLSWEQVSKYEADLIMRDSRASSMPEEDYNQIASWTAQPAVQAGQIGKWYTELVASYRGMTPILEELAADVEKSDPDIV